MASTATALVGAPLRRVLLALAAGGHLRVREGETRVAVTAPGDADQPVRPVFIMDIETASWGPWTRGQDVDAVNMTHRGLYALMGRLGVPLDVLATAIDGSLG